MVVPPNQEYIISAPQAGLINKLNVAIGDTVVKGQSLAQLNSPSLLALQQQYLKAISEKHVALAGYQRDKKLHQEGVISKRRWLETRSRYNGVASEENESKQLLEIAGMSEGAIKTLAKTRRLGSYLDVQSPIAGAVLERMVAAGERVDMLAPLYRIANLETLWLEINIPQEKLANIKVGDRVQIENTNIIAQISLLGQSVNQRNQTVLARAIIEGQQAVRAGQTVNVQVIHLAEESAYKVPDAAIAQREGVAYVFVKQPQGFKVVPVKTIGKQGNYSIITGDLAGDETLAIKGAVALKAMWMGLGGDEE